MGAPNLIGSAAVFWPHTRMHPAENGEGYAFRETYRDESGEQSLRTERGHGYVCRDLQELWDLYYAVQWAIMDAQGDECDALNSLVTRNCPSPPTWIGQLTPEHGP